MNASTATRRAVLKSGVAALVLGFAVPATVRHAAASTGGELGAWLEITADGKVRIAQPQSEMGQGIWTSMAQLIAEELEVDWEDVEIFSPIAGAAFNHPFYGFQTTAESFSIRAFWEPARQVGAKAREMLKRAAAERWGVYPGGLQARSGSIVNPLTGQSLAYGVLVSEAAKYPAPDNVQLKRPDEWRIIGRSVGRNDTPAKLDGSAIYGTDVRVEGMLTAVPVFPPSFTGKVRSIDDAAARAISGVRHIVSLENVVYVVADSFWPATKGAAALSVDWDLGDAADLSTAAVRRDLRDAVANQRGKPVEEVGDIEAATSSAARIVEVTLEAPYLAHATMEPMNTTAHYTPDKLTIWSPTQAQGLMGFVAGAVGLDGSQVECHTTFLGGGLGRRFEIDLPIHAARVSKEVGAPVQVMWSREDDMRGGFYRPAAAARLRAAIDADGMVTGFDGALACPSILARAVPDLAKGDIDHTSVDGVAEGKSPAGVPFHRQYEFGAASRVVYAMENRAIPVGFWRSVAHSQNAWFMEGFVNEIARETNQDPVALRMKLMKSDRNRTVLERLAERAGWGSPAAGHHQGIAIHEAFGTVLGNVFEIAVEGNAIRLVKVTSVADVGHAVHPDTIEAQMVSGAITGITASLWGEVTMQKGRVDQGNFDTYRMLTLAETPEFDVEILQLGGPVGGIGEPGTPPVAPALVHAVQNATGKTIRSLPLTASGFDLA
ncbi:MAG: molybdopterin cofactor-binding domain-containing protein [Pseudomonadota bacterium]